METIRSEGTFVVSPEEPPHVSAAGPARAGPEAVNPGWQIKAEEEFEEVVVHELHAASHALYWFALFFSQWFGMSSFDHDGDGDLDPEDMELWLHRKGLVKSNTQAVRAIEEKKRSAQRKRVSIEILKERLEGDHRSLDQQLQEQGQDVAHDGNIFSEWDRDGDGDIDIEDVLNSAVMGSRVSGKAVEDEMMDNLIKKKRLPWFIIFECSVCFLLWLVMSMKSSPSEFLELKAGVDSFAPNMTDLRLSTECVDNRSQVWRWLTYQWTHVGAVHVGMNVFLNAILGIPLESLHGSIRMALMFNIGVFGGACNYFVNDGHTVVVGCSGGCYALIGMHCSDVVMNWKQKRFRWITLIFLALLVSVDVFSFTMSLAAETTSHSAHFGGFVAGVCIGVILGKNLRVSFGDQVIMVFMAIIGGGLTTFCLIWLFVQRTPRNIWEAASGVDGYCWIRQVYNASMDPDQWLCVRCGTDSCIDYWTPMFAVPVSKTVCSVWQYNPA